MITIIDYGLGNVGSIKNMFKRIGIQTQITSDHEKINQSNKIILPGVGAFDTAMTELKERDLITVLNKKVIDNKTPLLGICLGMQLLLENSEEGTLPGLGYIKGNSRKFHFQDSDMKIPHMGWNQINIKKKHSITQGLEKSKFYFVHSYYVEVKEEKERLMTTHYGSDFDSAIIKNNIFGVQFHPEKSHKFGMQLFKNFSQL